MPERINIHEDSVANKVISAEIATWGDLRRTDRYEYTNNDKYQELLTLAREHVGESLVAAALVSAWDGDALEGPYEYGNNIKAARKTAREVKSMQKFVNENPDEVGLHIGEYDLILFGLKKTHMSAHYDPEFGRHAYLYLEARNQTLISMISGRFADHIEKGDSSYRLFSAGFNEIQRGICPKIMHDRVKPLVFGRDSISTYYSKLALEASADGGTTHRLSSLPYGIWRVRSQDAELATSLDTINEKYGLHEMWADRYRNEVGSKAAHVLLRNMIDAPKHGWHGFRDRMLVSMSGFFEDESKVFGTEPELFIPAAKRHAERLGTSNDEADLVLAVEFVLKP